MSTFEKLQQVAKEAMNASEPGSVDYQLSQYIMLCLTSWQQVLLQHPEYLEQGKQDQPKASPEKAQHIMSRVQELSTEINRCMEELNKPEEPVTLSNGEIENFTIKLEGKSYRCACGCNVFHKPDKTRLGLYECNACKTRFSGE